MNRLLELQKKIDALVIEAENEVKRIGAQPNQDEVMSIEDQNKMSDLLDRLSSAMNELSEYAKEDSISKHHPIPNFTKGTNHE